MKFAVVEEEERREAHQASIRSGGEVNRLIECCGSRNPPPVDDRLGQSTKDVVDVRPPLLCRDLLEWNGTNRSA